MTSPPPRRGRRLAGLTAVLGAAVLLVVGKAATATPPTTAALGTTEPMPDPGAGSAAPPPSADVPSAPAPPSARSGPSPSSATRSAPAPSSAPRSAPAPSSPAAPTASYLGTPVDVGYGTVQVRVTLTGGRITDVQAVRLPSGGRSSEIAAYAAPRLRREVLVAQSARIDTVSGASYTSDGYARSVQSALDAAPR